MKFPILKRLKALWHLSEYGDLDLTKVVEAHSGELEEWKAVEKDHRPKLKRALIIPYKRRDPVREIVGEEKPIL